MCPSAAGKRVSRAHGCPSEREALTGQEAGPCPGSPSSWGVGTIAPSTPAFEHPPQRFAAPPPLHDQPLPSRLWPINGPVAAKSRGPRLHKILGFSDRPATRLPGPGSGPLRLLKDRMRYRDRAHSTLTPHTHLTLHTHTSLTPPPPHLYLTPHAPHTHIPYAPHTSHTPHTPLTFYTHTSHPPLTHLTHTSPSTSTPHTHTSHTAHSTHRPHTPCSSHTHAP